MTHVSKTGRRAVASAAACVLLSVACELAPAQGTPSGFDLQARPVSATALAADQFPQPGLLQRTMRERGTGGMLDQYDIRYGGWIEGSNTYNFDRPPGGSNGPYRTFDDKSDDPTLNQFAFYVARDPIVSPDRFDTGFRVDLDYGSDMRYTQANGTNFYGSGYANRREFTTIPFQGNTFIDEIALPGQGSPNNQLDILQANVKVSLPVGNGLLVTAGKFVTPWGMERVNPTENTLYSHSIIFYVSQPKTFTGAMASYRIDDQWNVMGGVVVGWDQSLEDNNDVPSGIAQVSYFYDEHTEFVLSAIVGPEESDNNSDTRWMVDLTAQHRMDRDVTLGCEVVIGYEPDVGTTRIRPVGFDQKFLAVNGDDAWWWGAAGYVSYQLDDAGKYVLQFRGEWFNDGDGARLIATEVWSATIGLNVRPFLEHEIGKNLVLRPEIRYDYANADLYDGNSRQGQVTLATDIVFSY